MRLSGKRILLGVSGSIAAYKSAELTRLLIKEGAEVQVIMSREAHNFITPLTLSVLSNNSVFTEFTDPASGTWNNHVALGLSADAYIIAPATANTIAKLANGYCEDLLSAVYLSARCPVYLAPAMDLDMYAHPATTENISKLIAFGINIIGPDAGDLASGLSGNGRMVEPAEITSYIIKALSHEPLLAGKKILVSAGPTREAIDPVRFLSNHSSGKMGVAIAEELSLRGADVTLICGPGIKKPASHNIKCIDIISAADLYDVCMENFPLSDVIIMAAAVADFTPAVMQNEKIKKQDTDATLKLKATRDILSEMGKGKNENQVLVGFALETENELNNAYAKLEKKNLDFIVLNSMRDNGAGFNTDTNKITIIDKNKEVTAFDLKPKKVVAGLIADHLISSLKKK
jgi:phosphopantothenoylcysteine decarboxylase / phosphopantothenate---cysteine ligase